MNHHHQSSLSLENPRRRFPSPSFGPIVSCTLSIARFWRYQVAIAQYRKHQLSPRSWRKGCRWFLAGKYLTATIAGGIIGIIAITTNSTLSHFAHYFELHSIEWRYRVFLGCLSKFSPVFFAELFLNFSISLSQRCLSLQGKRDLCLYWLLTLAWVIVRIEHRDHTCSWEPRSKLKILGQPCHLSVYF